MFVNRRKFLQYAGLSPFLTLLLDGIKTNTAWAGVKLGTSKAFSETWLQSMARSLASQPFVPSQIVFPAELQDLTYDQYRDIRYRSEKAIWKDEASKFQLQLFHSGFHYKVPVEIHIVSGGHAQPVKYSPSLFSFGPLVKAPPAESEIGFSGLRIHTPINTSDYFDEFAVFQGASYFRAIGRKQIYGLSARGLAIDTGQPKGEEFPIFRSFWIEQPDTTDHSITVHALLDSPGITGAYKFKLKPDKNTEIDVSSVLFPRRDLDHVGIAPLTSMFLFAPNDRNSIDDFRPRVHDSDGLAIWNGTGEWMWRPLINPNRLQFTSFVDNGPKGFGLLQRERNFSAYQDLESRYERRPSLWVEPLESWGEGSVDLVELPTKEEIHDNIVAYWRPKAVLKKDQSYQFNYRLYWCWEPPFRFEKARVVQSRIGSAIKSGNRLFIIDFKGMSASEDKKTLEANLTASAGKIINVVVQPNLEIGGHRLSFEFEPDGAKQADLRGMLMAMGERTSEVWVYRWEG